MSRPKKEFRSTTILLVRRGGRVALAGDGQVTHGDTVMKSGARKVRRLYNEKILCGFAGATADAFSLLSRFEGKLEQYHGNLERAVIEPDDGGVLAIGSGGPYALAAARALAEHTELSAREIAERALRIAGEICIYTNQNIVIEEI